MNPETITLVSLCDVYPSICIRFLKQYSSSLAIHLQLDPLL